MLKSMTAYARSSFKSEIGELVVELQSVNRKFLEIAVSVPKEFSCFEINLKKWLSPFVSRGQVSLKVFVSYENISPIIVNPNLPLARQIKHAWDQIEKELNLPSKEFNLALLSDVEGILLFEENLQEEDRYLHVLKEALDLAIEKFVRMKLQEGAFLQVDILERTKKIHTWMKDVEKKAPFATKKYREKLVSRLEGLIPQNVENEERILREVALFAEKVDIAEEITRFFCHLTHFEELINSETSNIGKTLEFVLQELNREVNTVGSKASDLEISRYVIDIKSELERIREQIQNVE
jgi:uncharacterized protein (TIGR00255 family)